MPPREMGACPVFGPNIPETHRRDRRRLTIAYPRLYNHPSYSCATRREFGAWLRLDGSPRGIRPDPGPLAA
jgi:hypothetical protein